MHDWDGKVVLEQTGSRPQVAFESQDNNVPKIKQ